MATCDKMIEGNLVSFQCPMDAGHDGPCAAHESPRSVRERRRWEQDQASEQASATLGQFQGPAQTTAQSKTENPTPPPGYETCPHCSSKGCEQCNYRGYRFARSLERRALHPKPDVHVPTKQRVGACPPCERGEHSSCVVLTAGDLREELALVGVALDCECWSLTDDPALHPDLAEIPTPTKQREGDQPLPQQVDEPCVQDRIIAAMIESKRVGVQRYGSTLKTFNGRDTLQDATDEARDLYVYLTALQMAREADRQHLITAVAEAFRSYGSIEGDDEAAAVAVDAILNATGGLGVGDKDTFITDAAALVYSSSVDWQASELDWRGRQYPMDEWLGQMFGTVYDEVIKGSQ